MLYPTRNYWIEATRIACQLSHPAYDCFYMALAQALELPFVTADERLLRRVGASALTELKTLVQPLSDWA